METGVASTAGRWRALYALRVIHPFPTLANVLAVALFAVIARHGLPSVDQIGRLLATMFCVQSAIGAANDATDVQIDRLSKPYKPIVAGALSRRAAVGVAVMSGVSASILAATFGLNAWLLAMAGLGCGLAYDAGLKRTRFSVVPYILALPLLPLWVWVALDRYTRGLLWVYPFGILIGVALYLGNTAPDIAADSAAGVAGTAHRLGLRRTLVGAWSCLALTLLLGPLLAPVAGYRTVLVAVAAGAAALCLVPAVVLSWGRPGAGRLRTSWGLMIGASLIFALGWLAAAP